MQVLFHSWRYFVSQATAWRSRWLVGSSRRRMSGSAKSARARATRILHPPEKFCVGFFCMSGSNPNPARISLALLSADAASMSVSLWKIHASLSPSASVSPPAFSFSCSASCSSIKP
mmetsp:Transcript_52587/g.102852  ORF Transcript_52587/g.102852 Transcript_52587/m.102852 type:complete len:117 (+) Transcript_52587:1133-1483(+)